MDSSPTELKPFIKAQQKIDKKRDEQMWSMGIYVMGAVQVAIERNLSGKKSKAKYFEKPLLQESASSDNLEKELITEEEKRTERDKLLLTLQIMQSNFELKKKVE